MRDGLTGGVYHVTSRGDRREVIYSDDADRRTWVDLFAEVCERFNWRCHAWCQIGNHYHVVVETSDANLARGMCKLWGQVFHLLIPCAEVSGVRSFICLFSSDIVF